VWNKKRVSFCSETFVRTIFCWERHLARYDRDENTNGVSPHVEQRTVSETGLSRQTSVELPEIKYKANPNQQFRSSHKGQRDCERDRAKQYFRRERAKTWVNTARHAKHIISWLLDFPRNLIFISGIS
jgi:hypothetical protein